MTGALGGSLALQRGLSRRHFPCPHGRLVPSARVTSLRRKLSDSPVAGRGASLRSFRRWGKQFQAQSELAGMEAHLLHVSSGLREASSLLGSRTDLSLFHGSAREQASPRSKRGCRCGSTHPRAVSQTSEENDSASALQTESGLQDEGKGPNGQVFSSQSLLQGPNGAAVGGEVVKDTSSWLHTSGTGAGAKDSLLHQLLQKPQLILLALMLPGAAFLASFLSSQPRSYRAVIQFPEACGVTVGTPVRIRGAEVGTVVALNPSLRGVNAVVEVRDETTVIPKAASFIANRSGLVAEPLIDITPSDTLGPLTHGPREVDGCHKEGKIVCDGDIVSGDPGVAVDELVGLWIKIGRASEEEKARRFPRT